MPYIPRPELVVSCAHCHRDFTCNSLRRRYCCNSCNVLASYARNGRPAARAEEPVETKKQRIKLALAEAMRKKDEAKAKMLRLATAEAEAKRLKTRLNKR